MAQEHFEAQLWSNLQALAGSWLDGGRSSANLTTLFLRIVNDPRTREHFGTALTSLGTSPDMADAVTVASVEFLVALLDDPKVPQLLQQMLTDRRISAMVVLGREAVADGLPRKILKLRSRTDHNPLSAYVVNLAMHGRGGNILLMLTPDQYRRLRPSAGAGILLERRS